MNYSLFFKEFPEKQLIMHSAKLIVSCQLPIKFDRLSDFIRSACGFGAPSFVRKGVLEVAVNCSKYKP
jgi:hypothetical protein